MPKFCANLSLLFPEVDLPDRFEAAARAGFTAVECQFPYAWDKALLAERLLAHDLILVLHNLPAGDWERGERGIACHPDRVGEFRDGVARAMEYAEALGCTRMNCLAGMRPPGVNAKDADETLIDNLRFAADHLARAGIRLLLEPVNTRDVPGFHVHGTNHAVRIMDAASAPNLALQYDVYHMQIMEGDLASTIKRHFPRIGHFQVAGVPERHEPDTGEVSYPFLFDLMDRLGYDGWVGCEYNPGGDTAEGLGWVMPYL